MRVKEYVCGVGWDRVSQRERERGREQVRSCVSRQMIYDEWHGLRYISINTVKFVVSLVLYLLPRYHFNSIDLIYYSNVKF